MLNAGYGVFQMLRARLALVLEVAEVMQLVRDDWAADRRAVLLIADRHHAVQDRVFGVEAGVAEVARGTDRSAVRARLA